MAVSFVRVFSCNKEGFSVNGKFHLKRCFFLFFFCMFSLQVFFFLQGAEVFFAKGFVFFLQVFFARFVFFLSFVSLGREFVFLKKKIWVFVSKGFNLIFVSGVFFEEFSFFLMGSIFSDFF